VYDFRQQISGGKNNKANRGNKRGNQNGKGGKPATSTDRKTSKSKERRP
jgi:hypothetical protein